MSSKRSRVHPRFKTKYRVGNWPAYDRGLVDRGDLTIWISIDAIDGWRPRPSGVRRIYLLLDIMRRASFHTTRLPGPLRFPGGPSQRRWTTPPSSTTLKRRPVLARRA